MKHSKPVRFLKIATSILTASLFFFSCKKGDVKITPPLNDNSLPSAAVYNVKLISGDDKKVRFSIDLALFKDSRNMEYGFGTGEFKIDTLDNRYAFKTIKSILNGSGSATNYSSIMLMDQSGSTSSTDPDDLRIDAGKIFCRNMGNGNESWVWWFSNGYNKVGKSFSTDTAQLVKDVESVRKLGKSGTDLYISQLAAVTELSKTGSKPTKALLTFTDGENTGSGTSSAQVSTSATNNKVRLYNIGLGASSDDYLLDQAIATGGAFMYAKDAQQLISMFGNLGKLLDGTAKFYSVEFEMTPIGTGTISQGKSYSIILKVNTPWGYTIDVPVRVKY